MLLGAIDSYTTIASKVEMRNGRTARIRSQTLAAMPIAAFMLWSPAALVPAEPIWESLSLTGYSDRLSVQQGETIRFMVSTREPEYRADIVRLIHGDPHPNGPGFKEELILTPVNGRYPGRRQELRPGSYVEVADEALLQPPGSLTLQAWVNPTTLQDGDQAIVAKWSAGEDAGYGLFVGSEGGLSFWIGNEAQGVRRVTSGTPMQAARWHFVAASYDAENGAVTLYQQPFRSWPVGEGGVIVTRPVSIRSAGRNRAALLLGATGRSTNSGGDGVGNFFSGKIESPRVFGRALAAEEIERLRGDASASEVGASLIAAWDFSKNISSELVTDVSPNRLHGKTVNMPMRAATGHRWTGKETNFTHSPNEYGAIHFHDDDLADARWQVDFAFKAPSGLRSGVYAARLRAGNNEDYIPFFVRPKKGTADARIAYLIPTFNYLAYANYNSQIHGLLSLYDHHSDGSGVTYASRLIPLLDMRPKLAKEVSAAGKPFARHLSADLYLVDWMEAKGFDYDVITDDDLAAEGAELLAPYKVVVTGSHPEYTSEGMLDGLEAYLNSGGRLMYLGGNGFYWVTSQFPGLPHVIEVRRWGGTRAWQAEPGEYHHSSTGELGGLWRFRGRPPQKLVGVGFSAQGWRADGRCGLNRPYRRQPDSFDPRAAFIFDGIGEEEIISDFASLGLGRGAAGDELDRLDYALGTPAHALLLATASGFSQDYQHVIEELPTMHSTRTESGNPLVRSDLVFFEYPNGGAVFSVGSISWFGSLSDNGYDNNVSRITGNVLERFADDDPLPRPPNAR